MVVTKMYEKAGVPFYEIGGQPMIRYVEELKARLAKRKMGDNGTIPL